MTLTGSKAQAATLLLVLASILERGHKSCLFSQLDCIAIAPQNFQNFQNFQNQIFQITGINFEKYQNWNGQWMEKFELKKTWNVFMIKDLLKKNN